ncbi:lantibiotic dehydratase [Streptacidiphilus sp. P02-A3a]|uniref:lantibiotic dehydratase n=1 Tax=Streptacidiphilus sp. P02-A3a TaxID=2704468 RepID=UPI0015FA5E53|nr:lantibiotic dehydratase [Streptacidiphilus sp. P02-A3a]QMU71790.1 lantibiotic dehydratase [Streptacidiphilus sp. P02-A3a]
MSEPILLPDGGWRLWRHFALRGPGFPVTGVLRLAPQGLAEAADRFGAGAELAGADWRTFEAAFADAAVDTARELQTIARRSDFRAAVAWQNRAVLRSGIAPFLAWTPSAAGRTSMPRQREELVAHYWQRFCVKNDTIGFFGPVGWATLDPELRGVEVDCGTGLITRSEVFFSSWSIDELARTLDRDPALRLWLAPRRLPYLRFGEAEVRIPGRPAQPVSALEHQVLLRCDGVRPAREIQRELADQAAPETVEQVLEQLVRRRWIAWRLEIPATTYPERHLRRTLEGIGDPAVREPALAGLAVLERGRDRVQAAGTDAEELVSALAALEGDFADLADAPAQRAKGTRTAPNRALVYADCRRSATARVGSAVLEALTPLELCLTASRWMTDRFAEVVGARIAEAYQRLRAQQRTVDLGSLWFECLPAPHSRSIADIDAIQAELRERWAAIIGAPEDARRVERTSADIADQVRKAFGDPGTGWSLSRYASPDVMLIAEGLQAVERGEFTLVLGELHVAMNTLGASLFVSQHPDRDELIAETTADFPGPRLIPMLPKELPLIRWSARSRPALERPHDYYVALVDHTADPHRPRTVRCADVSVEEREGRLVAELPDGAVFDLLDVFCHAMTNRVMDRFRIRPDDDHSPRVTVDKMVLSRETWRVAAGQLPFATEKNEARRFVRARHWQAATGLPRHVFVVSPAEPRPFYVDFDSPVYVNILAKAIRRLAARDPQARLTVSEMLPTPEQAWLTDDQGHRYSSELRLVAVDRLKVPGGAT